MILLLFCLKTEYKIRHTDTDVMLAEGDVGRSSGAEFAACGCLRADPLREVRGAAGARDRGEELELEKGPSEGS